MTAERIKEMFGILLIGDGVLAAISPHRHPRLWMFGPKSYQQSLRALVKRPALKRAIGIGQVGLGVWLASRQWPR